MSNDDSLIEISIPDIQGMGEILKPSDHPVMGKQRLVRFLPAVPGMKELFPCIWMSPYRTREKLEANGPSELLVKCLILVSKGPPRPEIACISIRPDDLEKFPLAPVEW
jgi:hypothetical protein